MSRGQAHCSLPPLKVQSEVIATADLPFRSFKGTTLGLLQSRSTKELIKSDVGAKIQRVQDRKLVAAVVELPAGQAGFAGADDLPGKRPADFPQEGFKRPPQLVYRFAGGEGGHFGRDAGGELLQGCKDRFLLRLGHR